MAVKIWTGAAGDNDTDNPANWRPCGPSGTVTTLKYKDCRVEYRGPFFEMVIQGKSVVKADTSCPVCGAEPYPGAEECSMHLPLRPLKITGPLEPVYQGDDGDRLTARLKQKQVDEPVVVEGRTR